MILSKDPTGHDGFWTIIRKLGWGPQPSTFELGDFEDIGVIKLQVHKLSQSSSFSKLSILVDHFYEDSPREKPSPSPLGSGGSHSVDK